jgi:hypothetical protein
LEQANDPNQQYQLTKRGINFLMGSPIWNWKLQVCVNWCIKKHKT